jgi:hypothetical protein
LEEVVVDGRTVLNWMIEKESVKWWTGPWLKIEPKNKFL